MANSDSTRPAQFPLARAMEKKMFLFEGMWRSEKQCVLISSIEKTWQRKKKFQVSVHLHKISQSYFNDKVKCAFKSVFHENKIRSSRDLKTKFWKVVDDYGTKFSTDKISKSFDGEPCSYDWYALHSSCIREVLATTKATLASQGRRDEWEAKSAWMLVSKKDLSTVCVVGDIHSSIRSLCFIIDKNRDLFDPSPSLKLREGCCLVFTGDLVDRGPFGLHILAIVFTLLNENPENVFVCCGNHEDCIIYSQYGLAKEIEYLSAIEEEEPVGSCNESGYATGYMSAVDHLPHFVVLHNSHGTLSFQHGAPAVHSGNLTFNTSLIHDPQSRLKWGDIFRTQPSCDAPSPRGAGNIDMGVQCVLTYMNNNGIDYNISGHQDTVNYMCFSKPSRSTIQYFKAEMVQDAGWIANVNFREDERVIDVSDQRVHITSTALDCKRNKHLQCHTYMRMTTPSCTERSKAELQASSIVMARSSPTLKPNKGCRHY